MSMPIRDANEGLPDIDAYQIPPPIEGVDLVGSEVDPPVRGSVQDLTPVQYEGVNCFVARMTDGGSLFDYGRFFYIPGSGELRTAVRHDIFVGLGRPETWQGMSLDDLRDCYDEPVAQYLLDSAVLERFRQRGVRTHHIGLIDTSVSPARVITGERGDVMSDMSLVERFAVVKPTQTAEGYNYDEYFAALEQGQPIVFGVENIFRLGIPGGSSLLQRYEKLLQADIGPKERASRVAELLEPYGVSSLRPWMRLPCATPDYTTKYQAYDDQLSSDQAARLFGGQFVADHVKDVLALCTAYAHKYFKHMGLELWDLKWEVATDGYQIVVVDTVDPDGVRVTAEVRISAGKKVHVHFNKQAVRDYYRILHPEWIAALGDAKRRSDVEGRDWHDIYDEGVSLGEYLAVPELEPEFAEIQRRKNAYISQGVDDSAARRQIALDELAFYQSKGQDQLAAFMAFNRAR